MASDCKEVRRAWGQGTGLPEHQAHLAGCAGCQRATAGFRRLDSLLASEPVPLVPLGFTASVLAAVDARRRRDLVRARQHAAGWLVAAGLLAAVGTHLWEAVRSTLGLAELGLGAETWRPDLAPLEPFVGDPASLWEGLGASVQSAAAAGPELPALLLLVVVPFLIALNWALCRRTPLRGMA